MKITNYIGIVAFFYFVALPGNIFSEEKKKKETDPINIGNYNVTVTATKTPHTLMTVPVAVNILTIKEIKKTNAQSVGDILGLFSGLQIQSNGYSRSTVKIHGLPSKYTLVLIDGQRLKGRHADSIDLSHIPIDMIERIETLKGPASVLYGSDAVAGVINIITKNKMDKSKFNMFTSYGTGNTAKVSLNHGSKLGKLSYILNGDIFKSDNMGDGYQYSGYNTQGSLKFDFSKNSLLLMKFGLYDEKGDYLDDSKLNMNLRFKTILDNNSYLSIKGYFFKIDRLDIRPGRDSRTWDEKTFRGEIQYVRNIEKNNLLSAGLEIRKDNIDYTLIDGSKTQNIYSFFAQDEWELSNIITLILGFRTDSHDLWGTEFSPKIGACLNVLPETKIKLSVGKGFIAPSLSDLYETQYYHPWGGGYWLGGNTDLKPEYSTGYNIDIEHKFFNNFIFKISYFRNDLKDMITNEKTDELINGQAVYRSINLENASSNGLEVEINKQFGESFSGSLSYSYVKTDIEATGLEFPYSPRHSVSTYLNYYNKKIGLNFNLNGKYMSKRFTNSSNSDVLNGAVLLDCKVSKRVLKSLDVFFAVNNILDENIEKESRYFKQGRTVTAGFKFSL